MISAEDQEAYNDDVGGIVVAAFKFERENEDELDVDEGTRLVTLERRDEWWFAETEDKSQRGIIPISYVMSVEEYDRMQTLAADEDEGQVDVDQDYYEEQDAEEEEQEDIQAQAPEQVLEQVGEAPPPEEDLGTSYEDLEAKFSALQKKVADVKLTIDDEEPANVDPRGLPPTPDEAAAVHQAGSPPPPSPAQAAAALAQPPPPSPAQAAAALGQPPPPSPAQAAAALGQPPPPSPAQAAAALGQMPPSPQQAAAAYSLQQQQQIQTPPPPSPQQAAAAYGLQQQQQQQTSMPPPPAPDQAMRQLQATQAEQARREAEQARRRAAEEEESKSRAAELRHKREEEYRLQQEALARDREAQAQIHRFAQQHDSEYQGKQAMGQAIEAVKQAVAADGQGRLVDAYKLYTQSCELFAYVLNVNAMRPQHQVIAERVQGYLSRMSALEPSICEGPWSDGVTRPGPHITRYKDRVKVLLTLAKVAGFNPIPYGDELRVKARFAQSQNKLRDSFRHYNEALEYYMCQHKLLKEQKRPADPKIVELLTQMLDKAESLKGQIK